MKDNIDIGQLYRMPWSKNDNPNGWVEITTDCNLKCPGCYRGCNRQRHSPEHEDLHKIKEQILQLKEIRNCQTISVSGGEPLLHPQVMEVVSFINELGLKVLLFTNGKLLTKEKLIQLKEYGMTGVIIRVDALREEGEMSEASLNNLRQKYSDLVDQVGGIFLGFTCVINKTNIDQIPDIIKWMQKNSRKVNLLVLILMRQVIFEEQEKLNATDFVKLSDLHRVISDQLPDLKYNAFLGSQAEDMKIKWLYSIWFSLDRKVLTYANKRFIELIQSIYHFKMGKYVYILNKQKYVLSIFKLISLGIIGAGMNTVLKKYILAVMRKPFLLFKKPHMQVLTIVDPPSFVNGERDLCDACPDAILYNDRLVPSCCLEEIKRFGKTYRLDL